MGRLRVAVVGVGHLGKEHARVYAGSPQAELVAVVDPDRGRGTAVAEKYGVRYLSDYRDLRDAVDALSVASPTKQHFEIARHFLERGVSVLVEKPMTSSLEEAVSLVETSRRSEGVLQVGHIERFNPALAAIEPFVAKPRYLESIRVSPYPFRSSDIGVVLDLMIHDIDIILHLTRSEVKEIEALGVSVLSESEDMATARIVFSDGAVANVTASRVSRKKVRQTRIFQKDCYISFDYAERRASVCRRPEKLPRSLLEAGTWHPAQEAEREALLKKLFCVEQLPVNDREPLQLEIESFVKCVRDAGTPAVSGEEALKAMRTAHAIIEKIRSNSWNSRA